MFLSLMVSIKCTKKPTHTDRYLHAESHYHPAQKQSAIHLYIEFSSKMNIYISDKEHLQIKLNHLKITLQKNGHDKKHIIKIINKHARQWSLTYNQTKGSSIFIGDIKQTQLSLNHPKR